MANLKRIQTSAELDELFEESSRRPVWILKHSLTCGVSAAAREEFQRFVDGEPDGVFALLEVQRARPLSQEVAARTGVRHESPQVLLLRDGRATWHASHWDVDENALRQAAAAAQPPLEIPITAVS